MENPGSATVFVGSYRLCLWLILISIGFTAWKYELKSCVALEKILYFNYKPNSRREDDCCIWSVSNTKINGLLQCIFEEDRSNCLSNKSVERLDGLCG